MLPDATAPEPAVRLLAEHLSRTTGLSMSQRARDQLARLVIPRARDCGMSVEAYVAKVSGEAPWGEELEVLLADLTVGETYFFRDPNQFTALRKHILPEIIARRRKSGKLRLRILSAGCASGEEPYSISMLLDELLTDRDEWQITIVGVDINVVALRTAVRARYTPWALRETSTYYLKRYFQEVDEAFDLDPRIRSSVVFLYGNVAMDPLLNTLPGLMWMDLVLCRNMLMYLTPKTRKAALHQIVSATAPGGWLLTGPADVLHTAVPGCAPRQIAGTLVFERMDVPLERVGAVVATETVQAPPTEAVDQGREPLSPKAPPEQPQRGSRTFGPRPASSSKAREIAARKQPRAPLAPKTPRRSAPEGEPRITLPSERTVSRLEEVQALADRGEVARALQMLERLLASSPELAEGYLLKGLILWQVGALSQALESMRSCLYLEPNNLFGHYASAILNRQAGCLQGVRRHAAQARKLAEELPEEQPIPGWKAMTAGRLQRLLEEQVDLIPGRTVKQD